jgi:hypothetical protein
VSKDHQRYQQRSESDVKRDNAVAQLGKAIVNFAETHSDDAKQKRQWPVIMGTLKTIVGHGFNADTGKPKPEKTLAPRKDATACCCHNKYARKSGGGKTRTPKGK